MNSEVRTQAPILVIDDDVNGNEALCDHLRFRGYQPTSLHSGEAALRYLKSLRREEMPSVILLDVLMPGMNGCEVLNAVRSQEDTRKIPVMMLSILSRDEIQENLACPCTGYDAYVSKPFNISDVVS